MLIIIISIFVFAVLFCWAAFAARQLSRGNSDSILIVIIVHFLFCGIPAFFDVTLGQPSYFNEIGFWHASRDVLVNIIYSIYVTLCPFVWWLTGRSVIQSKKSFSDISISSPFNGFQFTCIFMMILPVVIAAITLDGDTYLDYGYIAKNARTDDVSSWYSLIDLSVKLGVFASGLFLLYSKKIDIFKIAFIGLALFAMIWLNGKRHIVAIVIFMLLSILWQKGTLKGFRLTLAAALCGLALLAYSTMYQDLVRGISVKNAGFEDLYENFRIDYGRDDVIKMTIYAELNPEKMRILEYRGQSLLFNLLFFIPREIYPDKPWPYATYLTSAMLGMSYPKPLGWGMTTSWLEEAIANFGWLGVILGPLFISLICRVGDRLGIGLSRYMTILIACLFLAVQLSAFISIFLIWCIQILLSWRKGQKCPRLVRIRFRSDTSLVPPAHVTNTSEIQAQI